MLRVMFQLPDQLPVKADVGRIPVAGDYISFDKDHLLYKVELVQLVAHTRSYGREVDAVVTLI